MTIDPTTAVTTVGASAPSPAVSDPSTATGTVTADGAAQPNAPGQATKTDIFDYASDLKNKPPALDTLQPEGKAKYLSNPSVLGDQVLQKMETFHQRWQARGGLLDGQASAGPAGVGSNNVLPGPAAQNVPAGNTGSALGKTEVKTLSMIFDYGFETTMISTATSQFGKAISTLMRGQ